MVSCRFCKSAKEKGEKEGGPQESAKNSTSHEETGERRDHAPSRRRSKPEAVMFSVGTSTVQGGLLTQIPSVGAFFTG